MAKETSAIHRFRHYLNVPHYLIALWAVVNVAVYFENKKAGFMVTVGLVLYIVITAIIYHGSQSHIEQGVLNFASDYSVDQKEMLEQLSLPYAMLDEDGKFLWMNDAFAAVTGRDETYRKSAASIFKELSRETLAKHPEQRFEIPVQFGESSYIAEISRIENENAIEQAVAGKRMALLLTDVTEFQTIRRDKEDQQLCYALLSIDNYDETLEQVEPVRRSLVTAVIDRKINSYFRNADAIVRKTERDKYLIIFQQKYLPAFEEDKFSLLEDVQTVKAENEAPITFSIGIGLGGSGYVENADFARAAFDLALGRGGSQCIVKNGKEVTSYGNRTKEIERNTRVKARVKAQALQELMQSRENIIVMGHAITDVDAFGAAVGVYCAARSVGRKCQIVVNTVTSSLRPLIDGFTPENGYPEDMFLNSEKAVNAVGPNTLIMVVDTNRPSYTDCPKLLEMKRSVVVFDHHRQGNEQIETPILSYIEPYASSACEMVAEVLQYFNEKVQLSPMESDVIYAGILIDTNNFMAKTGVRTFEAAAYLRRSGAEVTRVRKLLREDMGAYKARAEVVRHAEVYKGAFAISICDAKDVESPTIVGAQAANELLNIVGIKASFVLTEFNQKIYVSSRSIDEIDVQLIMERLGGGGHLNVAGAQIENSTFEEVKEKIQKILDDLIAEGEIAI